MGIYIYPQSRHSLNHIKSTLLVLFKEKRICVYIYMS